MKIAIALMSALVFAGCATVENRSSLNSLSDDRATDGVRRMQDEFNAIFTDA